MCRIAGILNYQQKPTESDIAKMRDSMRHGGPDDFGIYLDEQFPLAFGHRRLSLIDLSQAGHQPMQSDNGEIVLIFNGEIYNFQILRQQLLHKGYFFKSTSDTEVIIAAYQEWGKECISRFNGMFAFALLDKKQGKLLLARDHAGMKPLYYSIQNNSLYFASEVRAFKRIDPNWPENDDWKKYFLLFGHLPEPVTTLQNVQPVEKGACLEIDLHSITVNKSYFDKQYYNYTIYNEQEAIDKVRRTLKEAVERHLISDAPIGLFLSGGIDSSLLTLLSKPILKDNLHTLSIVFDHEKYSEKPYQDVIINKTGAKHQSFLVTENDFHESLPDIMEAMDQPSIDGINSYFICKYAKRSGLTAVISGLGADELFGGYPSFERAAFIERLGRVPKFILAAASFFNDDKKKKLNFLQFKTGIGEYLFNRGFFIPSQAAQLLDCKESEINQIIEKIALPKFEEKLPPLERISFLETNLYMKNQLLKDTDYMSMWHGLEVRVPFLDKELMNLVYSIEPAIRYSPELKKHLLIKAFSDELPREIWDRPKQGFAFPFDLWMKNLRGFQQNTNSKNLQERLISGKIHWSRYWTYVLSQQFNKPFVT